MKLKKSTRKADQCKEILCNYLKIGMGILQEISFVWDLVLVQFELITLRVKDS